MADEPTPFVDDAFHLLGRVWVRLVWSVLLVAVVGWDVFYFLSDQPVDPVQTFVAGIATGIIVAGFGTAMVRGTGRESGAGVVRAR